MTPKQRKAQNAYERERRRLHRLHRFEYAARERGFRSSPESTKSGAVRSQGPVVAACVVTHEPLIIKGSTIPSKFARRCASSIAEIVKAHAIAWAIGERLRRGDRPAQHLLGERSRDGARDRSAVCAAPTI